MNPILAALLGAASVAAIAFAWHRRTAMRLRSDAARRIRELEREVETQREQKARAKASLGEEITALRLEVERQRDELRTRTSDQQAAEAERRAPRIALDPCPRELSAWLSHRLATMVSGIEGGTFRLIEATPTMRGNSHELETLWLAIRRLRRFHDKLQAYTRVPRADLGVTPVERLLASLREELAASDLGFQIACTLPPEPTLPVRGEIEQLTSALTLVCAALRQLERHAMRLSIGLEACYEHAHPELHVELSLENDETVDAEHELPSAGFLVARTAAQNLLAAHGGGVSFDHEPGHAARALLRLPCHVIDEAKLENGEEPIDPPTASASHDPTLPPPPIRHRFGGVIVIESDAAVRSMLATELKAHGRSVFACPDGGAARALLQATPDRFEILVVDHDSRLAAGEALAATVADHCPELRVFVLSESPQDRWPAQFAERVTSIQKPFGVHELRRALGAALVR